MLKLRAIFIKLLTDHYCLFLAADEEASDCLFVSHQTGQDSPLCGSSVEPCQTLPRALQMVFDGGKICLDGRNSESHPYSCNPDGTKETKTNFMDKSMTIQGWFSHAHISCRWPYGLAFRRPRLNRVLRLNLSNLVFHNSGVILRNVSCSNVVITNCKFTNCTAAVAMGQGRSKNCRKSSLVITDTEFLNNTFMSIFAHLSNDFFILKISRCVFLGKKGRFNVTSDGRSGIGGVYVKSTTLQNRVRVSLSIDDTIFQNLGHAYNKFALAVRVQDLFSIGYLTIKNTSFLSNENSVFVLGGLNVRLANVTIKSTYGYAINAGGPPKLRAKASGVKVFLDHCILENNRVGIRMATTACLIRGKYCAMSDQTLVVNNTLFLGGPETRGTGDAIRFLENYGNQLGPSDYKSPNFEAVLLLQNVTFQGLHDCALYVGIGKNVHGLLSVKNCKFSNNSEFVYRLTERATVQIEFPKEDPPKCPKQGWSNSSKFIWNNTSRMPVIFEDSTFEGNVGISGALSFLNGNVTFKNCTFKDNEGFTLGGHIYMKPGYGRLNIVNSTFLQTRMNRLSKGTKYRMSSNGNFLHSGSAGPVIITNSSFTANVNRNFYPILAVTMSSSIKVDATSTIRCPHGRQIKLEKIEKREGFELTKMNIWNGQRSNTCWMKVNYIKVFCEECPSEFYSLQRGSVTGLDVEKRSTCLKCPYGASCERGSVKAKDNYWGLKMTTTPSSLKFFPCPLEYCNTPSHSSNFTYNGCHGHRSGVLCGKCSDGYSEALYSTSCRKKEKCNDHWFWLATIIYVVVFAVYFVFKPPVFSVLYRQILWFKKTPPSSNVQSMTHEAGKEHDSGYLKIVFYFYQVVEVVMIKSPEIALHMVPFIPPVIAIFNFQVKTLDDSIGCPFPGLNAVTKQLFLCSKFLATLLSIGVIYAIHRAASKSRYISSPSVTSYLAVALETLLLGYETLADTTLKLMHCVPLGADWRLFADGNIQCWQGWQYLIIAFIVVFIFPLILVLLWGSLMLAKNRVSAKEFLLACAFPLPCLLAWMYSAL